MNKFNILFILFTASLCYAVHVSANVEFSINIHQIKEKQNSDKTVTKEEKDSEMVVELGDTYFSYIQNGNRYIYDFANKRVFTINLSSKVFSDDSLYSNIGFRTYEFRNRLMLGGALAAGGIEDNPMLPVFSEHLFSLQQKDKKSELSQIEKDKVIYFSSAGKALLSYSKQGSQVTNKNKKMFIKFFRYVFGGHPQILEKLAFVNVIPESLRVHRYNVFNEDNALTISPIKTTPTKLFSLEGYSPGVLSNDKYPFSKFLNEIKYSKSISLENHLKQLLSQANNYYQSRNYLDTILSYLEYNLASGLALPKVFNEQQPTLIKDATVKKLLASLSPKSKEEAEKHLTSLQSLVEKSKYQKHVIQIFEANTQGGLGNHQKAKELFYGAIKASPHITGAYKDLGDLYFNDYNAVLAWRCWDVARKIAPTHKMLSSITKFESRLSKDNPEFF